MTEGNDRTWTIKYVDQRLDDLRDFAQGLRDADNLRDGLLRQNIEHRLEVLNEFSERMKRLESTFASIGALKAQEETLRATLKATDETVRATILSIQKEFRDSRDRDREDFDKIAHWKSNIEGRLWVLALVPGVAAVVAAIVAVWQAT